MTIRWPRLISASVSIVAALVMLVVVYRGTSLFTGVNTNRGRQARATATYSLTIPAAASVAVPFGSGTSAPSGSFSTETAPSGTSRFASISIADGGTTPESLTVVVGTSVAWTNMGSLGHRIVSTSAPGKSRFDTGTVLEQGQVYIVTMTAIGTYTYHDPDHPDIHGTIVVQ